MEIVFKSDLSCDLLREPPSGIFEQSLEPDLLQIKEFASGAASHNDLTFNVIVVSWMLKRKFGRHLAGDCFREFQIVMGGRRHRLRQFNSIFFAEDMDVDIHYSSSFGKSKFDESHPVINLVPELHGVKGQMIAQIRPVRSRAFEIFDGDQDFLQLFKIHCNESEAGFQLAIHMIPVLDYWT